MKGLKMVCRKATFLYLIQPRAN